MNYAHLLALALLVLPAAVPTVLTGTALAAPASALNGTWQGKLDGFYELDARFTVQGSRVAGGLRFGKTDFPLSGTWDAAKNLVTFKYTYAKDVYTVRATLKGSTLSGVTISPKGKQTALSLTRTTAAGNSLKAEPYVMSGVVRDAAGKPLAGVEVFADHTAFYNMNAVGKTDPQGRYRIPLAHQPGTWAAGAYLKLTSGGSATETRLKADDDTPFDGARGAVRNFTLDASDLPSGKVNTTVAHSNVELDYGTLEFTFTPDGPNIMGSAAAFTRKFRSGYGIENVPLGRYFVSATQVLNGVRQQLLLSSVDQRDYSSKVRATFHDDGDRYGNTMELFLKNP